MYLLSPELETLSHTQHCTTTELAILYLGTIRKVNAQSYVFSGPKFYRKGKRDGREGKKDRR